MLKLLTLFLIVASTDTIAAGLPVFDSINWLQNISMIVQQFQQIQITKNQIERELKAAKSVLSRMGKLNPDSVDSLARQIKQFRLGVRGIGYGYQNVSKQFDRLYATNGDFTKKLEAWQKQSDNSVKDAMSSHGLLQNSQENMKDLNEVLQAKRNSESEAEALQAMGEINAIQSRQLADLSQMIASDSRAKQSVLMEKRSLDKKQRAEAEELMKNFNEHETSMPLTHLPPLGTTAPRR